MLPHNPWPAAGIRLGGILLAGLVIGLIIGNAALGILLVLAATGVFHTFNLVRMERWLRLGRSIRPPEADGLWGVIFDGLHRLQRRHRSRRARLAELLRRFKESANAMPDAAVVLGGAGEMEWWNSRATRYLGLRWPQDEGLRIANLFRHPSFSQFLAREDWTEAVNVPSPLSEGTVLEVRIVPYGEDQRLLLARDVTRLHRLELMRRDFVANVSHELRTPLTVIRGMSETLEDAAPEADSEQRRALALIQQQTLRMERLVYDLLLLSRLETGEQSRTRGRIMVPRLLEGLLDEARALSGGRHEFSLDVDPHLDLLGDEGELRSAFSNLLVNAVKYSPQGGPIRIEWGRAGDDARFAVVDAGVGIPAHHIPRLTERFYRVDSGRAAGGGTGLGLAIVKHVLSRHEARLEITSGAGAGSTFSCHFPPQGARDAADSPIRERRRRGEPSSK